MYLCFRGAFKFLRRFSHVCITFIPPAVCSGEIPI